MFGRDLIEQVRADSAKEHRDIPTIVEKCILAVEHMGEFATAPMPAPILTPIVSSHGL
jgi:hypothetical protein